MTDESYSQEVQEALERAQVQRRPADLDEAGDGRPDETLADEVGFRRPEDREHTSEKEHPEGKN